MDGNTSDTYHIMDTCDAGVVLIVGGVRLGGGWIYECTHTSAGGDAYRKRMMGETSG